MRDLTTRICQNAFVDKIRDLQIDRDSYETLCSDLRELGKMWRDVNSVDKKLAGEVYCIVRTVNYAAAKMRELNMPETNEVEDMWTTLDALALECFAER